jgi:hypothetical protein
MAALALQAPGKLGPWTTLLGQYAATDSLGISLVFSEVFAEGTWYVSVISRDGSHGVTPGSAIVISQPLGSEEIARELANHVWLAVRAGVAPTEAFEGFNFNR